MIWISMKRQQRRLESWSARLMARMARVTRQPGECMGQFWRRLHRQGQRFMGQCGAGVRERRRRLLHRFAGHIARTSSLTLVDALRTRCLAWWRYYQR